LKPANMMKTYMRGESGVSLLETVVAPGVFAAIGVTFLAGIATTSKATFISDKKSIAQNLMERVKNAEYAYEASSNTASAIPARKDYTDYADAIISPTGAVYIIS